MLGGANRVCDPGKLGGCVGVGFLLWVVESRMQAEDQEAPWKFGFHDDLEPTNNPTGRGGSPGRDQAQTWLRNHTGTVLVASRGFARVVERDSEVLEGGEVDGLLDETRWRWDGQVFDGGKVIYRALLSY